MNYLSELINSNLSGWEFVLFLLACGGLTDIVTRDRIFRWLREMETRKVGSSFFSCQRCFGFWAGVIMFLIFMLNWNFIAYPFAASYVCVTIKNMRSWQE